MQFATTGEKLEVIRQALERGCISKEDFSRKVQNKAIIMESDGGRREFKASGYYISHISRIPNRKERCN
jgi:hypothetical protein